ncbi:hypothetical protein [Lacticaseibacillus suihuaensis]
MVWLISLAATGFVGLAAWLWLTHRHRLVGALLLGVTILTLLSGSLLTLQKAMQSPAAILVLTPRQTARFATSLKAGPPKQRVRFEVRDPSVDANTVGFVAGRGVAVSLPREDATLRLGVGDRVDVRVQHVVRVAGHWLCECRLLSADYRMSFGR